MQSVPFVLVISVQYSTRIKCLRYMAVISDNRVSHATSTIYFLFIYGESEMFTQFLAYEAKALRASSQRFLSREAHILLYLRENDHSSMKQVQLATGLSTRGFYLIVKKLETARLVTISDATDDKRKRLLALTPLGVADVDNMPLAD